MVNTHTVAGRLMMLNLANYAQYERELISERTREAMQHMKAQGVRLGVAQYGYRHSQRLDDKGRRILEPVEAEQEVIRQIAAWREQGHHWQIIASMLKEKGIPSRRGKDWARIVISKLMERKGHHEQKRFKKTPTPPRICDKGQAAERARQLRAGGLSLRELGRRLRKGGIVPPCGGEWHAASVAELLTFRTEADPASTADRARALRNAGHSLRHIAVYLTQEGHIPARGGCWHPATVSSLLSSSTDESNQVMAADS